MPEHFISSVRLLKALFDSETKEAFLSREAPKIYNHPRAVAASQSAALMGFANTIADIYSKNGVPNKNGYKALLNNASTLAEELEACMNTTGSDSLEVAQLIMARKSLGVMILSNFLFILDADDKVKHGCVMCCIDGLAV